MRESTPSIQSKRGTKRSKRFTSSIRYKQVRKAVLKCTQSHPEVHRHAVRKYTLSHPEVHRDAVRKYTQCHLEVNRVTSSYHSKQLGLLEEDAHWNSTLDEVSISESPNKIRELFAIILVFCQVGDLMKLWEKHQNSLSEDVKKQIEAEQGNIDLYLDIIYNQCLILLEDIVISMSGKALLQFGFLSPSREYYFQLRSQCYFLDSPGGTRKTFLINLLLAKIRCERSIAIAVASSGIAATLIDGGKTAHSAFKLPPISHHSESVNCNISKQSDMAHVLREAKLIIWDECTIAHKKGIEALNRTLQDIRGCNQMMGGLTVLLSGDFRQTLPVVLRGTRADIVKTCLKTSFLWPHIKVVSLKINMRVHLQHDLRAEMFSKLLIGIGDGKIKEMEGRINIPESLGNIVGDLITLTERIYPNIHQIGIDCSSWLKERAILTPTNDSANNINNFLLNKLTTKHAKYESVDSVVEAEVAVHYPVEFLNTFNPPGIPPHVLNLKIEAPIMLLRNLNPPKLCNGTKLQVKNLHNVIEATILTGKYEGEVVFIPRIPLIPSDYHFELKRIQYPVTVCYAMTINKAQGQTLKMAGIDL
ncbi:ATP-dependent DNA helicase [Trichonephila clavipes]|nr:ATP-dependent DNA helicase [Trichonephila clavipes]